MNDKEIIKGLLGLIQPRCDKHDCTSPATRKTIHKSSLIIGGSNKYCDNCEYHRPDAVEYEELYEADLIREAIKSIEEDGIPEYIPSMLNTGPVDLNEYDIDSTSQIVEGSQVAISQDGYGEYCVFLVDPITVALVKK